MKLTTQPLIDSITAFIRKADDDLADRLKAEGFVGVDEAIDAIEGLTGNFEKAYRQRYNEVLKRLQDATGLDEFISDVWPDIKDEKDLEELLRKILRKKFDSLLKSFTQSWILNGNPEFDSWDNRITMYAQDFIESWSSDLAGIMHLNTDKEIEAILIEGQKKALSIPELSKVLSDQKIRDAGYKARRVAQTETLRVSSYAQLESMRQDPCVSHKKWVHTGAHKNEPRQNHMDYPPNGQVVLIEQPFNLTGADGNAYLPMCPRDTNLPAAESVNCHCIMQPVQTLFGLTQEERDRRRQEVMDQVDAQWTLLHPSAGNYT